MAAQRNKVTAPELEQFFVNDVQLTGVTLGAGAYGSVEEVEIPGARVAAKKLHTQLINLGSPQQVEKWVTDFVGECKLMSQLRHPHIVQFLGVCYLPGSQIPILLMEKLQTSLDNLLETSHNIPMDVKVYLLTGTSRGVVYLHSHTPPIAHRDLTARNILIDSGLTAKIADLGVARMVNIQPGQLAATMTRGPGNNLYMPPEAVQEEGATRYSTAIDIFSFGVVSLFTFTQIFPKNLKPATYQDPVSGRIFGRSEIERREDYIQEMKTAHGQTHPLVKLTLDCLDYNPNSRPTAFEVLRRLEEVGRTVPTQNCTETKLELLQRNRDEVQQIQRQLFDKDAQIESLQITVDCLQTEKQDQQQQINHLQATKQKQQRQIDHLQTEKAENQERLKELATLHQQQLEIQRKEIKELSGQLRSLVLQPQVARSPETERDVAVLCPKVTPGNLTQTEPIKTLPQAPPQSTVVPSSITFNWRRCNNRPWDMHIQGQPVSLNGKLYARGFSRVETQTALQYTPEHDQWAELPPPPVSFFTIATVRSQLLVIGGMNKSNSKLTDTVLTFNERSQQWVQSYPAMPTALCKLAAVGYQNHLIVAGGRNSDEEWVSNVSALDTTSNKWKITQPLPRTEFYNRVLVENTLYLVGWDNQTVLRAHVPTLISGAKSGVWETVTNIPFQWSYPVTIGNTLLSVGGSHSGNPTASIQMYNPTTNQWTKVGDLPEPMISLFCIAINSELYILYFSPQVSPSVHVYASKLTIAY